MHRHQCISSRQVSSTCPVQQHSHRDCASGPVCVPSSIAAEVGSPPFIGSTRKAISTATPILKYLPRRHSTIWGVYVNVYTLIPAAMSFTWAGRGGDVGVRGGCGSGRVNVLTSSDHITLCTSWGSHRSDTPPSVL